MGRACETNQWVHSATVQLGRSNDCLQKVKRHGASSAELLKPRTDDCQAFEQIIQLTAPCNVSAGAHEHLLLTDTVLTAPLLPMPQHRQQQSVRVCLVEHNALELGLEPLDGVFLGHSVLCAHSPLALAPPSHPVPARCTPSYQAQASRCSLAECRHEASTLLPMCKYIESGVKCRMQIVNPCGPFVFLLFHTLHARTDWQSRLQTDEAHPGRSSWM